MGKSSQAEPVLETAKREIKEELAVNVELTDQSTPRLTGSCPMVLFVESIDIFLLDALIRKHLVFTRQRGKNGQGGHARDQVEVD